VTRRAPLIAGIAPLLVAVASFPIGCGSSVRAADPVSAAATTGDARLRIVDYRPDLVLPLTGFVGYHIHLAFEADEKFINLAAGDGAALDVGAESNHLLLKAKLPTSGTNLTILTTRRVYFIDYRALARAPRPDEAVYSIEFRYPPAPAVADRPPAGAAAGVAEALLQPAASRNHNYWYCGSPALRPIAASDDGIQLRLRFAAQAELPAIYASTGDGAESLVNNDVEDDTVVIHRLAPRFVLRRGRLVGCVVNRADGIPGRRASSGTVQDDVRRETVGVHP